MLYHNGLVARIDRFSASKVEMYAGVMAGVFQCERVLSRDRLTTI